MQLLSTTRRRLAAGASVLALAGGAGGVLASGAFAAASTAPSAAASPAAMTVAASKTHAHAHAHHRGLLGRTDHATFELRRHGHWTTYVLDRGKVVSVTATRITIKRPDGVTASIALASTTKYHGVSSEKAVKTGGHATVISTGGSAVSVGQGLKAHAKTTSAQQMAVVGS